MTSALMNLETETFAAEREWTVDGIPVLSASIALPRPVNCRDRTARRIDRFYQLQGRSYLRYCEGWLFPQAAESYRLALAGSAPLPCHTAQLTYRVTCSENGVWSLWTQTCEKADGRRMVVRRGDTWDLRTGYPLPLGAFFPKRFPVRKTLLGCAEAEIRRQESCGISRYHESWKQELRRSFNKDHFFIEPDGLRFFWQMGAVAPPAEGIPTFSLPFSPEGCRWPYGAPGDAKGE